MTLGLAELWLVIVGLLVGAGLSVSVLVILARRATTSAARVDEWERFERTLETELERARREERPLTLVRVPLDSGPGAQDGRSPADRITLRRLDHPFRFADSAYLIAPGTGLDARAALLERLRSALDGQHPASLRAATFPDDGLSSGALLSRLERPQDPDGSGRATPQERIIDRRDVS